MDGRRLSISLFRLRKTGFTNETNTSQAKKNEYLDSILLRVSWNKVLSRKKKGEVRWGRSLPNQQGGGSVVGEVNL